MSGADDSRDTARGDVLILGAGFTRAVSDHFPLTDELGNLVRDQLGEAQPSQWLPEGAFKNGSFEAWLSSLAEDQPDLSDGDNQERRALFTRSIDMTQSILLDRQAAAAAGEAPDWLRRLIWLAHIERLTIISFNYDTVVEAAVDATTIPNWQASVRVQRYDILQHLPPRSRRLQFAEALLPTFRLLKLHGSLDWYWVPDDRSGATIQWAQDHRPPGLSPFLTPPSNSKSSFYANPISRELWRRAGAGLRDAHRVVLIGYSLPGTDLTVSGMLQRHLDFDEVEIIVVNLDPNPVTKRLVRLGVPRSRIDEIGGIDAVAQFVTQLEQRTSQNLLERLQRTPPADLDAPLVMGLEWHGRIVDEIRGAPSGPVLLLSKNAGPMALAGRPDADPAWVPPGRTMRDLLKVDSGRDDSLMARLPDGTTFTIIGHDVIELGEVVRSHVLTASTGSAGLGPVPPIG